MVDPMDNLNDGDLKLPAALEAQLKAGDAFGVAPGELAKFDERVMAQARLHFRAKPQPVVIARIGPSRGRFWRIGAAVAAAAALIGIAISLPPLLQDDAARNSHGPIAIDPRKSTEPAAEGDINLDGRIDIVDAYLLQRQVEGGPSISLWDDFNGDGILDAQDVSVIAAMAVAIKGDRL